MAWTCNWNIASIDPMDLSYWRELAEAVSERASALNMGVIVPTPISRSADMLGLAGGMAAAIEALRSSGRWFDRFQFDSNYDAAGDGWTPCEAGPAPSDVLPSTVPIPVLPVSGGAPRSYAMRRAMLAMRDAIDAMRCVWVMPRNMGGFDFGDTAGASANLVSRKAVAEDGTDRAETWGSRIRGGVSAEWGWLCYAEETARRSYNDADYMVYFVPVQPVAPSAVCGIRWTVLAPVGGDIYVHAIPLTDPDGSASGGNATSPAAVEHVAGPGDAIGRVSLPWTRTRGFSSVAPASPAQGWARIGSATAGATTEWFRTGRPSAPQPSAQGMAAAEAALLALAPGADPDEFVYEPVSEIGTGFEIDAAYIDLTPVLQKVTNP